MEPTTAMMIISAVGTGLSAIGSIQAGKSQEKAHQYNAQIAANKAMVDEEQSRTNLRKLLAKQKVLYAKAGVDISSGSPLEVLTDTAAEGEKEARNIRYAGQNTSNQELFYGSQKKKAGTIQAGSTFLTGLGQAGTNYYAAKKKVYA